jgi:hypothetical protein
MNGVFKTFWESGAIRLVIVYCQETGKIRLRRIFDEKGKEREPSTFLQSKRNVEEIWDDIWPRFKFFDQRGFEQEPFDAQEDYFDQEVQVPMIQDWTYYGDGEYSIYEDVDYYEDLAFNSKYSDGW